MVIFKPVKIYIRSSLVINFIRFIFKDVKSKITIGVLSFSSNQAIPTFSTKNEIKCFDFYCYYDTKIYINGKPLTHYEIKIILTRFLH